MSCRRSVAVRGWLLLLVAAFLSSIDTSSAAVVAAQSYSIGTGNNNATIISPNNITQPVGHVCQELQMTYPAETYISPQPQYIAANTDYWTPTAALGPACVFTPTKAQHLAHAIRLIGHYHIPFAVRGGGHMPIAGFNNINSTGILISTKAFTRIAMSTDKKTLSFGPGLQWQDIYRYLEPSGLLVVGGRVGIVGIPGYYLGGGVSFMGNQYGWASSSLVRAEVVLASGQVVNATRNNQYADLLWALKGGANSFAIITDLEALLHPAPAPSIGYASYGSNDTVKAKWQDAIVQLAHTGNADDRHGVIPVAISINTGPAAYSCFRFYNGLDNQTQAAFTSANPPAILANFSAPNLRPESDSFSPKSMYRYTQEPPSSTSAGLKVYNQRFYHLVLPADASALSLALDIASREAALALGGGKTAFSIFSFTAMPMPTSFFANARKVDGAFGNGNPAGGPQGIDPATAGPQIWLELSHGYTPHKGGEAAVTAYLTRLDGLLRKALMDNGTPAKPFLYLNDADGFQHVFAGYPAENLARLRRIRSSYDPGRLYTDQLVGGFKVDPTRS